MPKAVTLKLAAEHYDISIAGGAPGGAPMASRWARSSRDTQVLVGGVILAMHAPDGTVAGQTCGNLGREGVGVGRRVGLAVGSGAAVAGAGRRRGCRGRVVGEFAGDLVGQDMPGHSDS